MNIGSAGHKILFALWKVEVIRYADKGSPVEVIHYADKGSPVEVIRYADKGSPVEVIHYADKGSPVEPVPSHIIPIHKYNRDLFPQYQL